MPLLRVQKEDLIARLTEELQNSRVALVFAYTALNMKANNTLRTKSFAAGARIRMISNNLLALILKNIGREIEIPSRQLALAYGFNDEIEAAKTLVEFATQTETLEVLGGWVDGNFFDAVQIKTLAALPNKVSLQAQLIGRLNGLIGGLAYSLNFPIQKLAFVATALHSVQLTGSSSVLGVKTADGSSDESANEKIESDEISVEAEEKSENMTEETVEKSESKTENK